MIDKIYKISIEAALKAGEKILEIYESANFEVEIKADESPLTKADKAAHEAIISFLIDTPYPILSEEGREILYSERSKWSTFWLVDPLDGTKEFIKKNGEFSVNIALIEDGKPVFGVVYAPVLDEVYVGVVGEGFWIGSKKEALEEVRVKRKALSVESPPSLKLRRTRKGPYRVVASRSHLNEDTENYLNKLKSEKGEIEIVSIGSSLKLCQVASSEADEYPRLGPTMEWDIAAAHAVAKGAGKGVYEFEAYEKGELIELCYNKENLLNPYFIVK